MDNLLHKLMLGGSMAALFAAMPAGAQAQDQGDNSQSIEQVVVSASRISLAGYSQPTPVTVVGTAQLEQSAYSNMADVLNQIPQVQSNFSSISASQTGTGTVGVTGADFVNLRELGNLRTLVLFDGQRYVQTGFSAQAGYDISVLPTEVISRVDVVTGGASAAWGSDAVAGVVNFVIDKNLTGFKGSIQGSQTEFGPQRNVAVDGAWGTDLFGGRGHIEVAGSASFQPDFVMLSQAGWFRDAWWVSNPAYTASNGKPQYVVANNVGYANQTPGGIINASPAGTSAAANALRGIEFTGSGVPQVVNFGNITANALSNGGSLTATDTQAGNTAIGTPENKYTLFAYGRYKLTDTIQASVQLNAGFSNGENVPNSVQQTSLTIRSDNAYIPASVIAAMRTGGITSFILGTTDTNNYNELGATGGNFNSQTRGGGLGPNVELDHHLFARAVFTLEGELGDDWSWKAYVQSSETRFNATVLNDPITANLQNAEDAVTVTAANVGKSGLAQGSIACRSTLTGTPFAANAYPFANAQSGCVPLNVFGTGVASPAALAYVDGVSNGTSNYVDSKLEQDVAEGSMQGTLPWGLPAGKVALAFGAGYRKEAARVNTGALDAGLQFAAGDFTPFPDTSYSVEEGFAEVNAPILKNDIVNSLDFDMAGRLTSYSTSGLVGTWKLGAVSQINDDIRLRTTWSQDIRAPSVYELYTRGSAAQHAETDPNTQNTIQTVLLFTNGNANLVPEVAHTFSSGVVLTPTFIPGLSLSIDWFNIKIGGEITTVAPTTVLSECDAALVNIIQPNVMGNPKNPVCAADLVFGGPGGALSAINNTYINISSQSTSGMDLQADYTMDFLDGSLHWTTTDSLNDENTIRIPGAAANDIAGSENFNGSQFAPGPKWKGLLSATYSTSSYSLTAQTRWYGTNVYTNLANTGNLSSAAVANEYDPAYFELPFVAFLDLRGSYKWNGNIQFYGAVDNLLDTPPPLIPDNAANPQIQVTSFDTNVNFYPMLGRTFRIGVRFNY